MNSIRIRLFTILIVATGIVWLSAFSWVQQSTRAKVERVLDARLAEAGQMVSSLISDRRIDVAQATALATDKFSRSIAAPDSAEYSHKLSCQIWSLEGVLVGSSASAPVGKLTDNDTGFSTSLVDGEEWRVYSVVNEELGMRILVGDSYVVRDRLVRDVTTGLLLPALFMFPILALLIWFSVRRGLRPLDQMAEALSDRAADDLSPVSVLPLPQEVKPMGNALNGLFSRVADMREREKSFTSFAAHELKTPLAGIKTQAQVAAISQDPATRLQALNRIQQGVERADRMVRQLLALAALEGQESASHAKASVASVVRDVASDLTRIATDRNIGIDIKDLDAGGMRADAILLSVAVRNVVENAIIAAPDDSRVEIAVIGGADGCLVTVSDRGRGIADADRSQISDRFFRGKGAADGGSGLGLSIVATALRRLGGEIEFRPRAGGGEVVTLRLPSHTDNQG
ncbi:two-component system, OmpR family, sensor histidine kinase QseC [Sulfitobacter brevis]|uniref:histidine kinase n=1 Tax=Sulfitobacter brevis TaxID=74348 RepID=A0A1I2BBJ8_9RHOB|nr:ATP-binding protein [Sulfitobacter brevis]SFE53466.1 two-component system, OmpR family, sensor histidine kinase QseC [Sulfitobacter brevis]